MLPDMYSLMPMWIPPPREEHPLERECPSLRPEVRRGWLRLLMREPPVDPRPPVVENPPHEVEDPVAAETP